MPTITFWSEHASEGTLPNDVVVQSAQFRELERIRDGFSTCVWLLT